MTGQVAAELQVINLVRNVILTASVDEPVREHVTLQQVLESGILAETTDPDAVMQRIADRLAHQILAQLNGISEQKISPWRIENTTESMNQALEALYFWGATDEQIMAVLGADLHGRLLGWRHGVGVEDALSDPEIGARLRAMMVVIHHLGRRFPEPEDVLNWMRSSNRAFGGLSPLDHMSSGRLKDLEEVRAYLRHRGELKAEQCL